ncbi:MAG: hypothetical protein ACE37E_01060 [Hyphomicrobiales bacterium]
MTRPIYPERQKARMTAEIQTGELSGRMLSFAEAVKANPKAFNVEHVRKLRNAAQIAVSAAELIELEHSNERRTANR